MVNLFPTSLIGKLHLILILCPHFILARSCKFTSSMLLPSFLLLGLEGIKGLMVGLFLSFEAFCGLALEIIYCSIQILVKIWLPELLLLDR